MKKREEREKKKAEVRARLEASSAKANKKKGFMTPERKKKLRVSENTQKSTTTSLVVRSYKLISASYETVLGHQLLLRKKAAEELKRQQETKANERRKVIAERTGEKKNTDDMNEGE